MAQGLREAVKTYLLRSEEVNAYLRKNPNDWSQFQEEINRTLDRLSGELTLFENENSHDEPRLYKFKRFFGRRLRRYFLFGEYIKWSLEKHYGYPGDFKIIDDIYLNCPRTCGFDRLWDNYFQRMGPSVATRNRKEDFKRIIADFLRMREHPVRIMDLASGPCRDIKEWFEEKPEEMQAVTVDCYDFDDNAIRYGQNLLGDYAKHVNFFKKNALRMALKKDIRSDIPYQYDLIFSTGLFDYLGDRVAQKLIGNLRQLLKSGALMCISNYRDKGSNPWAPLMEWVAEWELTYRTDEEFRNLFLQAGFPAKDVRTQYEPLKIMQYCLVRQP